MINLELLEQFTALSASMVRSACKCSEAPVVPEPVAPSVEKPKAAKAAKPAKTEAEPFAAPVPPPPWEDVTPEALRVLANDFVRMGKRAELKAVLDGLGIARVTECPEDRMGELMEALKNALAE
jgi:hypothetical protein